MVPRNPIDRRRFLQMSAGAAVFASGCSTDKPPAAAPGTPAGTTPGAPPGTVPTRVVGPTDPVVAATEASRATTGKLLQYQLRAAPATLALGPRQVNTWAFDDAIPGKVIRGTVGDLLEVAVKNDLPEHTTIHWHGLALRNDMDGVHDLTQPPIKPGETFNYRYVLPHAGTYFFHPHTGTQLDRALYAPLIIDDPNEPGGYDVDEVIMLDDWLDGIGRTPDDALRSLTTDMAAMPGMTPGGVREFESRALGGDAGDVDYPLHLINGRPTADRLTINVPAGGRARLRLINAGSDTAYRVALGGHRMTVTHTDGFPVIPVEVDTLLMGMGERYDVIIQPTSGAWPLVAVAEGKGVTVEAIVRTSDSEATAAPAPGEQPKELAGRMLALTDLKAVESARLPNKTPDVTELIRLTGSMMPYGWGFDGAAFPNRPPIEIRAGQRVRLTFENTTMMWHPIHLHGHTFQVGDDPAGPRKDTVIVLPGQHVSIQFDADNPGQWMIHCHNTYHLERGMAMVASYVP